MPVTEIGGRRLPFLRWSFLRAALGQRNLPKTWQVGDGREDALRDHVQQHARPGDLDDCIRVVDEFCYTRKFMMNVGDEKGAILEAAVAKAQPGLVLELGTYCGYSGLRIARAMPRDARLVSLEWSPGNAAVARAIWEHAGIDDRAFVVVGTLGDGWTADWLGFMPGTVDFVFVDHDKDAYVADLEQIVGRSWLRRGSVVVADNVGFPGVPAYRDWMRTHEGRGWQTVEHTAHVEYQSMLKDLVLESEYVGA
jgi:catechol O-methyltransferase